MLAFRAFTKVYLWVAFIISMNPHQCTDLIVVPQPRDRTQCNYIFARRLICVKIPLYRFDEDSIIGTLCLSAVEGDLEAQCNLSSQPLGSVPRVVAQEATPRYHHRRVLYSGNVSSMPTWRQQCFPGNMPTALNTNVKGYSFCFIA